MPNGFNLSSQGFHGGAARPVIGEQSLDYCLLFGAVAHEPSSAAFMGSDKIVRGVGQHFTSLVVGLPYIGLTWRHYTLQG